MDEHFKFFKVLIFLQNFDVEVACDFDPKLEVVFVFYKNAFLLESYLKP
jgi:hypothetical protein